MSRIKVYYNSACPVCNAGITDQRERMQACSADAEWIDIHNDPDRLDDIGASEEFVRKRLHVVDDSGQLQIGADAFHALFKRTPGQQRWARVLEQPIVRTAARWLYNAFAALLYVWNRAHKRW